MINCIVAKYGRLRANPLAKSCDTGAVRMSEFQRLIDDEFGSGYGQLLLRGHTLRDLGSRTGEEALEAGVAPKLVWLALCREMEIPQERWLGVDRPIVQRRDL